LKREGNTDIAWNVCTEPWWHNVDYVIKRNRSCLYCAIYSNTKFLFWQYITDKIYCDSSIGRNEATGEEKIFSPVSFCVLFYTVQRLGGV
jgi:hypothetical protein